MRLISFGLRIWATPEVVHLRIAAIVQASTTKNEMQANKQTWHDTANIGCFQYFCFLE